MKISPVAQGTGVPANSQSTSPNSEKMLRAKAIASGQAPEPGPVPRETTGDAQADRALKKIRMRTQMSTNRHEMQEPLVEQTGTVEPVETAPENPISDTGEPQGEVVEETKPLSPQFAALAKAKRALQVKERELAQREAELSAKASGPNLDEYVSKAELQANPLKVFDAGVTYDQLTEAILNNQSGFSPELKQMKDEIRALKEELTGQFTKRDQESEAQVLSQFKREADLITATGDEYATIREAKAQQTVVDLIHRTYKQTGEIMDIREALDAVENQLIEEALPFAQLKKVQSRLTPQQEAILDQQPPMVPKPNTKVMRTLTNRDSAKPGPLDRRARALAAFAGTLKRG